MKIIAVEYCPYIYEAEFSVMSMHSIEDKSSAARTMNKLKGEELKRDLMLLEINEDDGLCEYKRIDIMKESKMYSFRYKIYEVSND